MTRLALILSLVLAFAAGPSSLGGAAAAHDCCCRAACACPDESDEPQCDECGPAAPSDDESPSTVVARIVTAAPAPAVAAAAPAVEVEAAAGRPLVDAPRASGRSLLAHISLLRV